MSVFGKNIDRVFTEKQIEQMLAIAMTAGWKACSMGGPPPQPEFGWTPDGVPLLVRMYPEAPDVGR